ncbi:ClpXP protease specificity-enhancing factor SspB [Microbacteriaceae bacterium K1510]|nr:ClpXP protease specificity-enhancing factor SspB [Microbacteriaceae bacterium K1510]
MPDHIRYDLLTQQALRGVVRSVLTETAKKKVLPGDHHFYISFDTGAEGVRLSDRLKAQYPEQMTIILQHQFWDLKVTDDAFEVGLSFGGAPEKLVVPFDAIKGFFDPSVQFGLQFEEVTETEESNADAKDKPASKKKLPPAPQAISPIVTPPAPLPAAPAPIAPAKADKVETETSDKPDKPTGGGEVVRLDRFRKK